MATRSSQRGRVLVTGLAGFTGHYVAAALEQRGFAVAGAGDEPLPDCDLRDPDAVVRLVAAAEPDYVIHLAAISFVAHGSPADLYAVNTIGTDNLLRAISVAAPHVRKVVVASSANVYGNAVDDPITEQTLPAPVNHYACSKLAMEFMARTWFDRLPIIITRPFNYTGVGQAENFLVPKLVSHFVRRAPVIELGNLDVVRDFSDVRSVADAYAELLMSNAVGQVVNLCSGVGRSLQAIVDRLTELSGHGMDVRVNPALVRATDVGRLVGSSQRLNALINAGQWRSFDVTLEWMYRDWPT